MFTPEGAVVPAKYDKYKQINRFLELINDTLGDEVPGRPLHIVDFGCGKSYLTFIMYHFLAKVKKLAVEVTGVDLKADVIAHCQATADKYGYDNLHFVAGSIEGFQAGGTVDVVVSLHACDTATDYALFNAVSWKARHIFSVPCCQHELNKQMQGGNFPILMRHGIVQERFAALATDAIRANLLTAVGYRTQLMEFVDLAHTPKNLLIRATRANIPAEKRLEAWREVQALISEYRFQPKLVELLSDELTEI